MKRFLPALLAALLFSTLLHAQSLLPYRDGTRWGYCNMEGKIILPCTYDNAYPFTSAGAVVVVNNKYGLIDTKGNWLFPATFDSLGSFVNNIAIFKKEGKLGLTDKTGKIILPADYQKIELQKSGFYQLCLSEILNGFANKNGVLILPAEYREVNDFRYGRAVVQKKWSNDPWIIIDEKGNNVFSLKSGEGFYDNNAKYFSNGVLHYRTFSPNAGGGLYDSTGKMLIYIPDACCYNEEERKLRGMYLKGLFPATQRGEIKDTLTDGKVITVKHPVGYCDSTGKFVIKPKFNEAGEFKNGSALVLQDGKAWLINQKGESVMKEKYNSGFYVSDTRVIFRNNSNNYYLYESGGKLLATIEGLKQATATYWTEGIAEFKDGLAVVTFKDETRGYIDSMGRIMNGIRLNSGTPYNNGLARVKLDEEISNLNKKAISIGRQQWDYQDLNTRVFANGDSIYKAVSITDFIQKGQEKKPAFYHVSYIPNTQSKTQLLYNWYAVNDPRGLAPAGWVIPSEEDFMQLKKASCADSISSDILYALGFDNGGQRLLKETGLGTLFEGGWWTRTNQYKNNDEAKIILLLVSKDGQRPDLRFGVHPCYTGFPVRCMRKPVPVKPGIKLPPLPKLNCDSLLAITKAKIKPVKPVERKIESAVIEYAREMAGNYKDFSCVLTDSRSSREVTFTQASGKSHFTVERILAGYIKIDFELNINNTESGRFFLQFVMQTGEATRIGTGTAARTSIPLYKVEGKTDPYKPGVAYYRGENISGSYCPETRTIAINGEMVKYFNSSLVSRTKYRITGVK
jgi:hypothetical protein